MWATGTPTAAPRSRPTAASPAVALPATSTGEGVGYIPFDDFYEVEAGLTDAS